MEFFAILDVTIIWIFGRRLTGVVDVDMNVGADLETNVIAIIPGEGGPCSILMN